MAVVGRMSYRNPQTLIPRDLSELCVLAQLRIQPVGISSTHKYKGNYICACVIHTRGFRTPFYLSCRHQSIDCPPQYAQLIMIRDNIPTFHESMFELSLCLGHKRLLLTAELWKRSSFREFQHSSLGIAAWHQSSCLPESAPNQMSIGKGKWAFPLGTLQRSVQQRESL